MLKTIIVQKDEPYCHSKEALACVSHALLRDIEIQRVLMQDLGSFSSLIKDEGSLVVGTVEFVEKALQIKGLSQLPFFECYPTCFQDFYQQKINKVLLKEVDWNNKLQFIKPLKTKLFNGVRLNSKELQDLEEIEFIKTLPLDTEVYSCSLIEIEQEWRVYIKNREILGFERYDDGNSPDMFNMVFIQKLLTVCKINHNFAIDVARLAEGSWTVVECNDAWALGLYGKSIRPSDYIDFLYQRWRSLA